jgi:hypothetical protein
MNLGITGISDLSQNKYAAVMKELANGLAAWSGIFLLFFFVYQIATNESVSLFSWKSLLLRFYWDFCGYMSSFPQKNKIAILKFSNFLNPRAADLIC